MNLPLSPAQGRWTRILGEPVTPGQTGYEKPITGSGILRGILLKISATITITGASVTTGKGIRGLVSSIRMKRTNDTPIDMGQGIMDWHDLVKFFRKGITMAEDVVPAVATAQAVYTSYTWLPCDFGMDEYKNLAGFPMAKGLNVSMNFGSIASVKDANATLDALSYEMWGEFDQAAPSQKVSCIELHFNETTEQLASGYSGEKYGPVPAGRGLIAGIVRIDQNESGAELDDLVDVGIQHQSTLYSVAPAFASQEMHRGRFGSAPIAGQYIIVPDVMGKSPLNTDKSTSVYAKHLATGIQNVRWQSITAASMENVQG